MQASTSARAVTNAVTFSRCFATSRALAAKGPQKSTLKQAGKRRELGVGGKGKKSMQGSMGYIGKSLKLTYSMPGPPIDLSSLSTYEAPESDAVGQPTRFDRAVTDALEVTGLPRGFKEEYEKGGGAASVIRQVTVELADALEREASSSSQDARYMLTGDMGSGKSTLLLQTVANAIGEDWIVVYFPQVHKWIDSTSGYLYNEQTQTYHQASLAAEALQNIVKVNGSKLKGVKVGGKPVAQFVKDLVIDNRQAVGALEQVMEALAKQTERPVLLAVDEAHALFALSAYRSPEYQLLQAYHLSMPRLALDYLSGRKTFDRGMTLSTYSHTTPTLPPSNSFVYGLELPTSKPLTPYSKYEPIHLAHATSGFKKIEVPYGMSPKEAAGMFDLWSRRRWVPKSTDEVFMETFMAAAGNPKEMSRELLHDRQPHGQSEQTA